MADVYLGTNVGFAGSDVILRTSAVTVTTSSGGGGRVKNQMFPPRFRHLPDRNDDDEVLIAALI